MNLLRHSTPRRLHFMIHDCFVICKYVYITTFRFFWYETCMVICFWLCRTEANDLALLIAETVTGNSEVIVIDGYE